MTDDRMPWFACYQSKLLEALSGMKADAKLVYMIMILRIYDCGGPCPDPLESICARVGLNRRRVSDALDFLFKTGKLQREPDGIINPFAAEILAEQTSFRAGRQRAGAAGASRRWQKIQENQRNTDSTAMLLPLLPDSHLHLHIQEQKKESKTLAQATACASDWPKDFIDIFWKKYPRRVGKQAASKALARIKKSGLGWDMLCAGVERYAGWARDKEIRFVKHPATWLNAGCWDDEIEGQKFNGNGGMPTPTPPPGLTPIQLRDWKWEQITKAEQEATDGRQNH